MFGNQPKLEECYEIFIGKNETYDDKYQTAMLALMGMFNLTWFSSIFLLIINKHSIGAFIFIGYGAAIILSGLITGIIFKDKSLWMPIHISKVMVLIISPLIWFLTGGFFGWGGVWFLTVAIYLFLSAPAKYGNAWVWILRVEIVTVSLLSITHPEFVYKVDDKERNWSCMLMILIGAGYLFNEVVCKQRVFDFLQKKNEDITNSYNAQNQELLAMNQELTAVNEELTAVNEELNDITDRLKKANEYEEIARQEADKANQAKGRFLANMSHEIRTPINVVLGMNTMILRKSQDGEILKYADNIQSAGKSLLALINDILDFSKIEAGKMELIPVDYDLSSLIYDVHNMISSRVRDKELDFVLNVDESLPARCLGDDVRIRQILTNLLTNAVKYTHSGCVILDISRNENAPCQAEDEVSIRFSVTDTGIGIKEEDIEKLTEGFVRIEENRNRNIEGTGLGINIVVSLLEMMGSRLEIDSVYGEGSIFSFELVQKITNGDSIGDISARINQETHNSTEYKAQLCIPDCKLLIVDDNALNRAVFINLLTDMECEFEEAESGRECLELVAKNKYDIIFMDHMMPEMDGVETYRHMREMGDYINSETPVVILTANAISGAKEEYLAEGFREYLSKPIDIDKLEHIVEKLIPEEKKHPACKIIGRTAEKTGNGFVTEVGKDKADTAAGQKPVEDKCKDVTENLPYIDGVDWNSALQKLGNIELLTDIVEGVAEMAGDDMSALKKMYEKITFTGEGFADYRIKVHSMKSNAATIGANHVAVLAKYLEYAARDEDIDTINNLMPVFEKQWFELKSELERAFDLKVDKEMPALPDSELVYYLNILKESMDECDLDRADAVIEELKEHSYPNNQKELFDRVKSSVLNIDVSGCGDAIEEWKQKLG